MCGLQDSLSSNPQAPSSRTELTDKALFVGEGVPPALGAPKIGARTTRRHVDSRRLRSPVSRPSPRTAQRGFNQRRQDRLELHGRTLRRVLPSNDGPPSSSDARTPPPIVQPAVSSPVPRSPCLAPPHDAVDRCAGSTRRGGPRQGARRQTWRSLPRRASSSSLPPRGGWIYPPAFPPGRDHT